MILLNQPLLRNMVRALRLFRKVLIPFEVDGFLPNLLILLPRILMGSLLAFKYAPNKFGTPWTPERMKLSTLEVSQEFVAYIAYQGYPFDLTPEVYAWSIGFMEAFGGLLLIVGLNTRITSFFVFLTMLMSIFVRSWDGSWDILPVFFFFCLGLFYLGLGAGKFSLDHYLFRQFIP
ncbi:DoxX family protein [Maribacter sp. PR1]|uniref:DoxX family protein n=1 Tax=Maribacter cobaltidurans TaxID=1178778 RepID=A0ABU7IV45_9FLAO|nr:MULTISPECIES: DoxX family protein [Maribacter]MDC6389367.1 DoxX family protein [Maribacter sp. PR1]MEE1976755.1 DoxX family protein [Maribacter cobaltidurans]